MDTRKNDAELEEDQKQPAPAAGVEKEPKSDEEHGNAAEAEKEQDDEAEGKAKPEEAVVRKEEVDLGGGEVLSNEVLEKANADSENKQDAFPPDKAEQMEPVKDHGGGNAAVAAQGENAPDAAGKRECWSLRWGSVTLALK